MNRQFSRPSCVPCKTNKGRPNRTAWLHNRILLACSALSMTYPKSYGRLFLSPFRTSWFILLAGRWRCDSRRITATLLVQVLRFHGTQMSRRLGPVLVLALNKHGVDFIVKTIAIAPRQCSTFTRCSRAERPCFVG